MTIKISLLVALAALASGCATKEPDAVYWTSKSGISSIHHIHGRIDTVERLSAKESDVENIPDGEKAFQVSTLTVAVLPKAKADPSPKKEPKKDSGNSQLADEVHALKSQVKSLKEQVSAAVSPPAPAEQPAQQEAAAAATTPRMSQ